MSGIDMNPVHRSRIAPVFIFSGDVVFIILMITKRACSKKESGTEFTDQTLHIEVSHLVAVELTLIHKQFSAYLTQEFLSCMECRSMALEIASLGETMLADVADKWFLSCMFSNVHDEVLPDICGIVAITTGVNTVIRWMLDRDM
jgi:hypothetical protein